jgi:curved DNA-binding protein CbpA
MIKGINLVIGGSPLEVDYYYLLGIGEEASPKEIKMAYRKMAEVYHPDKLRKLPENSRKEGEEIMRLLNEAKSILLDPERRERYDERIGAGIELEEAVIVQGPKKNASNDYMVAIEKESMGKKMSRVLGSMKVAFRKDRDFQKKIAVAEEMVEAQVIEDDTKPTTFEITEDSDGEQEEEVEMKLRFTVVDDSPNQKNNQKEKEKEKKFKILAIEGSEEEEISEGEEVDMEWE